MAKKYPAVFVLIAVIAGIILSDFASISSWVFLILALSTFPLSIVAYFKEKSLAVGLLIMMILMSLSAFGYSFRYKTFPPGHIIHYVDDYQKYRIFGTVSDWPSIREHQTSIYLTVDSLSREGKTINGLGRILLQIGTVTTQFQYGDRVQFESQLYSIKGGKNPSGMDYRRYLNLKDVFAVAYLPHQYNILVDPTGSGYYMRLIDRLRKAITDTFKAALSPESAALASGFLIGETRDIPLDIYNLFRNSGTLHLLAVSGSNVALVLLVFIFLLRASPLTVRKRTLILLGVVIIFTLLSYNQPSVVRASIMAALVLLGRLFQRKINLNNIIATTALIILLIKPTEFFDIGFQLSFATAWGLIFLTPKITNIFKPIQRRLYYKYLIFPIIISVIAQIVALPLSAFYFQRLPLISFISNLIIVPLVSLIVLGEMVVLLASLLLPILGLFFGSLLDPLILLTISLLKVFGADRIAMVQAFDLSLFQLTGYYLLVTLAILSIKSFKPRRIFLFLVLILANIFLFSGVTNSREETRFMIFSTPGGIISFNELDSNQLVLADLPLRDYHITEKMILPYIENLKISNFELLVLSKDFQDIKESVYLYGRQKCSTLYLPAASKNLFSDLCYESNIPIDTSIVKYYLNNTDSNIQNKNQILLSDNILSYSFDSLKIIYISGHAITTELLHRYLEASKINIIVRSIIDKSDIDAVISEETAYPYLIICNRLTKAASQKLSLISTHLAVPTMVVETSEVGAVELIMEYGRLREIKCANYSLFRLKDTTRKPDKIKEIQ